MAATIQVNEAHSTGPTLTDITSANSRFTTDDVYYSSGTTNPVPVPASSNNYSYWRSWRLNCTVTPTTAVNNMKWYTDGTNSSPSGVTWLVQTANVGATAGYRQATGTPGTTGNVLNTTNHTGLTGAPVDPFTYNSGAPLSLTASLSNPSTGAFGDYVIMQMVVASTTATTGAITAETGSWAYDES